MIALFAAHILLGAISPAPVLPQDTLPRVYEAVPAPSSIVSDGDLSEAAWATAPWTEDFLDIRGPGHPTPSLRTRIKILWDDEYLYIGAELEEPHLWATLLERDAILYRDDDFEVFLDPDGDGLDYFELEINALGTEFDLFLDRPYNQGGRADIDWDMVGLKTGVSLWGSLNDPSDEDRGWSVEVAIPWEALAVPPPTPGVSWRVNFSRVDWPLEIVGDRYRKTAEPSRENRHPESNWVWSPQGAINMHIPERWGVVRFVRTSGN